MLLVSLLPAMEGATWSHSGTEVARLSVYLFLRAWCACSSLRRLSRRLPPSQDPVVEVPRQLQRGTTSLTLNAAAASHRVRHSALSESTTAVRTTRTHALDRRSHTRRTHKASC